jgi:hypothetical protein
LEKVLIEWIQRISQVKDELGGFSVCPFAKKAMEDKKVFWGYIEHEPEAYILRYLESTPEFEVVAFFNLSKNLTDENLIDIIKQLQFKRPDMVFLKDHPDKPGFINGVNTGNQVYPTILVQPRGKLIEAREKLKRTKYYDYWSEEYKNEIWSYGDEG